jgi:hypothetical protein
MKTLFASLCTVALLLTATLVVADQPECTGDRHYDGVGCCPVVTTTTLPPACQTDDDCEGDLVCVDGSCVTNKPAPCPDVTCTNVCDPTLVCNVNVCVDGKCANGSSGTDGAGTCVTAVDCSTTVNNTTTTVTVNRCPQAEDFIPCRRNPKTGRLNCPRKATPYRELVPYTKAKALGSKNPKAPKLP